MRPSPAPERQVLGSMVCMYLPNFLIISKVTRAGARTPDFPQPQCRVFYIATLTKTKKITVLKRAIPLPEREVQNNISDKESYSSSNANLPKMRPTYIYHFVHIYVQKCTYICTFQFSLFEGILWGCYHIEHT